MSERWWRQAAAVFGVIVCATSAAMLVQARDGGDKIPITTSSEEARKLYLDGRDLLEKLRGTDARRLFEQAVAKDPNFALAYVGLANTSGTNGEFMDPLLFARRRIEPDEGSIWSAPVNHASNDDGIEVGLSAGIGPRHLQLPDIRLRDLLRGDKLRAVGAAGVVAPLAWGLAAE